MKLAAIVTASVLVFAPVADAKCARQHLAAEVLPDATNGAIVVVASAGYDDASSDDTSKWTLHADGKTVAPVITVLAPGLSVYRLPKGVTAGELTDGTATLARIAATPKKPLRTRGHCGPALARQRDGAKAQLANHGHAEG